MSFCLQVAGDGDVFPMLAIYAPYVRDTAITFEYEVPSVAEYRARIEEITRFFPFYILEEDDVALFAENQYVVKDALCITTDVPELLEKALRLYQGRAFWDGTGDLDEAFLEEMRVRYGLVLL